VHSGFQLRQLRVLLFRHVQYHAMIGGPSTLWDCGMPKSRDDDVVVEYSTNAGEL